MRHGLILGCKLVASLWTDLMADGRGARGAREFHVDG